MNDMFETTANPSTDGPAATAAWLSSQVATLAEHLVDTPPALTAVMDRLGHVHVVADQLAEHLKGR